MTWDRLVHNPAGARSASALATVALLSSCALDLEPAAPEDGEDHKVAVSENALSGGSPASLGTQDFYGLVTVSGFGSCSAAAIDPYVVITSAHCLPVFSVSFLGESYDIDVASNGQVAVPDWTEGKTGSDLGMVFLDEPLRDRFGNEWSRSRGLWNAEGDDAEGESMFCFGRHTGSYRWGIFDATSYIDDSSGAFPGGLFAVGQGAQAKKGDSGGPCFDRTLPDQRLISLMSQGGTVNFVEGVATTPLDGQLRTWMALTYFGWLNSQ